jgi:hypothetical protein
MRTRGLCTRTSESGQTLGGPAVNIHAYASVVGDAMLNLRQALLWLGALLFAWAIVVGVEFGFERWGP